MSLELVGYVDLPPHAASGGFDHAAVDARRDLLYVAHTANDAVDVIDCAANRYRRSIPGLPRVAGALVCEAPDLVFTSNRAENTVAIFASGRDGARQGQGRNRAEWARVRDRSPAAPGGQRRRPVSPRLVYRLSRRRRRPRADRRCPDAGTDAVDGLRCRQRRVLREYRRPACDRRRRQRPGACRRYVSDSRQRARTDSSSIRRRGGSSARATRGAFSWSTRAPARW